MGTGTFKISIDHPCNQDWEKMQAGQNGKFCSHCAKTVVDLNSMTDAQIVEFIAKQTSSVCGRISKTRIATEFHYPSKNISGFNFSLVRYSLAGLLTFSALKSFGQTQLPLKETQVTDNSGKKNPGMILAQKKEMILKIRVLKADSSLLENAIVTVKSDNWQFTQQGGQQEISIPDSMENKFIIIMATAPGFYYKAQNVVMTKKEDADLSIFLEEQVEMLMGVIVLPPTEKKSSKTRCEKGK